MYYYHPEDGADEIVFQDPRIQTSWEKIFALLYDEDGACLLIANRNLLSKVDAYCFMGGEHYKQEIRECAWNIAGLCGVDLFSRIKCLEQPEDKEASNTFLEDSYER